MVASGAARPPSSERTRSGVSSDERGSLHPRVKEFCDTRGEVEQRLPELPWDDLAKWCNSFFRNSALTGGAEGGVPATDAGAGREDQTGFEEGTEPDSAEDSSGTEGRLVCVDSDYRPRMTHMFGVNEPCVVLLCSPPGAGKSFFSNELAENLKRTHKVSRSFIDGSDDRLVDMALTEILDVELPDASKPQFLIVDEFHMLKDYHKQDLFQWLELHA